MKFIVSKISRPIAIALTATIFLSACQTTAVYTSDVLKRKDPSLKVLIMPMDVELSEMALSGMTSVRADWSEAAHKNLSTALDEFLRERRAETIKYVTPISELDPKSDDVQLIKLFGAVGNAIALHKYVPGYALPNKNDAFDWSLGPDVRGLANKYDADYALFINIVDSYATAERATAMVVAAVLFGVALQGGMQQGNAALVDLRTGEIAWFNRLVRSAGDIRTTKPAKETITALMQEFPK